MTTYLDDCYESLRIASEQLGHAARALVAYSDEGDEVSSGVIQEIDRTRQVVDNLSSWVDGLRKRA